MTSREINYPSIKNSQVELQRLLNEGILKSISKVFLFCNACKSRIKVATNGDFCLNSHLKTQMHQFIVEESPVDWPEILKPSDELDDRFHVQRQKYERSQILARVPDLYKEWIDVKHNDYGYRFYCKICHVHTVTNIKRDLEKHMLTKSHQQNLQEYFNKVKCGKGSISLETFMKKCIGTPKKLQETKHEPLLTPKTTSPITKCTKLQTPKTPHIKRDPESPCKVTSKDSIRIYYQNVQSIRGNRKKKQFNRSLAQNYDVIVFTETWLNETSNLEIFDEGFDVYRCDRSTENTYKPGFGGVLVAVSSKLYSDSVTIAGFSCLEYICLKLLHNDHYIYIYCLYLPGELRRTIGPQHIKAIESIDYSRNDTLIVLGDFNIPDIVWTSSANNTFFQPDKRDRLLRSLERKKLYQLNNIQNEQGNVLDLIFVSDTNAIELSGVHEQVALMPVIKAHPPFEISIDSLKFPQHLSESAKQKAYSIRKDCVQQLEKLFADLDWDNFEQDNLHLDIRLIPK